MDISIETLRGLTDQRGVLTELVTRAEFAGDPPPFGSIYVATVEPGGVRGNHYHRAREEYLLILAGEALVVLEDPHTGERREERVSTLPSGEPTRVRIGRGVAHAVENVGPTLVILCAHSTTPYDPDAPDDFPYLMR